MVVGGLGQEEEENSVDSDDEEEEEDFPANFKEYMERELKYSRHEISEFGCKDISWVFWNRQDDDPTLSYDHSVDSKIRLNIRHALHKLISYPQLTQCLVQFWAPKRTLEGRTLLTTQFQPFALSATYFWDTINKLCEYRMGMCREYNNCFYVDAESGEEQLGLPGRVFLYKLPEHAPNVEHYTLKEYPQHDLALRCGIIKSWALPVFEQSSHTCVGVLEIAYNNIFEELHEYVSWDDKEFIGRMCENFQKFGLRCFDEEEKADFPANFKEYMEKELKCSQIEISDLQYRDEDISWVFWNRQDDDPTLSYDHSVDSKIRLNIRHALHKLISYPQLIQCLVQFWAPKRTLEGRTLLTTQFQPFALSATYFEDTINELCEYRMGMCREYNNKFYADAESGEVQLGLPGRVFLNKLPEHAPDVKHYTLKEYPQRDLALRCGIFESWALPVFEQSSHTCVGVLEIVYNNILAVDYEYVSWDDKEFIGRMYENFQEFGLLCFDGYKHWKIQDGDKNKALTTALQELNMVYESVCKIHDLPLALTWVSCRSCNHLLQSQFSVLDYCDEEDYAKYSFYLGLFKKFKKFFHLRKGQVAGRIVSNPNLLYCSDVKQFHIDEFPLVPFARGCKLGGWFTMCLQSSYTGDESYVLEFFLPKSTKNDENILTKLPKILGTMEKNFKTFKLASGQGLGEALSVEVIDFQYGQRCHSIQMFPATRFIPSLELVQDGGVMLQQDQQDQPSRDAINNGMCVVSETQNYNFPCFDSFKNGKVTTQLDSSDPSMDPSSNLQNVVTVERNILVVPNLKERKRMMQDRKHKKGGVRIEVSLEKILNCSLMKREAAARELKVSISTLKRVCRDFGIHRWPPRDIKEAWPFRPLPIENQRQILQLNSDLPSSNQALVGVSHIKPGFQDANMVTIKAKYGNDTIKFRLPLSSRFEELQKKVAKRLNLEAGTYYVKYKDEEDEENGLTLIACNEDLQDCMRTAKYLDKTSVVVLLELKQPITNLNPGLSGGQQTLFSPLRRQGRQSAEGELSIVPIVHTTGGEPSQSSSSQAPPAGGGQRRKRLRRQDLDASKFVEFKPPSTAAAEEMGDAAGAEAEEAAGKEPKEFASASLAKHRRLEAIIQEDSKDEGGGGDADEGDDNDDGMDNVAQLSMPMGGLAADDVAIVDMSDSPEETRVADQVQPRAEPVPYSLPKPESSVAIEVTSKIREPPPPADSLKSIGQNDNADELVTAMAAQHLRDEEEDEIEELPRSIVGGPFASQHGIGSSSTPSGSQQHSSTSTRIRSTDSFLARVACGSPGLSNGSILRDLRSSAEQDVATASTSLHSPACSTSQIRLATNSTSPHSPACSTSQILSPHPFARRMPPPPAQPSILFEDRQLEVNEEPSMGPTSITDSHLNSLFKDMIFTQTDDVLGGQGSAALGDFAVDLEMGEQNRDKVESREQTPPQPSPTADRGKGPADNEMEVPIRLFPAVYPVDEVYHPLLNAIARAHPETFAHFNPPSPGLGSMFLRNLHDMLIPWAQLSFFEFSLASEVAMQELTQDLANLGFDVGWLSARGFALKAARERVALRPEIQNLSALVESTRQSLTDLEARLAQARQHDRKLAAAALNFADLDPNELVLGELAS